MVIMVTTNYTFSKILPLLPCSVAAIILSHISLYYHIYTYIYLHILHIFYLYIYIYIYIYIVYIKLQRP